MWELNSVSAGDGTLALKQHLFRAYNGFADKRIKNLTKSNLFIVDDRSPKDFGADKQLYPWFCMMFVEVTGPCGIELAMHRGVPFSQEIGAWLEEGNGVLEASGVIKVPVAIGKHDRLQQLARLVRRIVEPGRRYPVPAYKFVCPRVAVSLDQLADVLAKVAKS